MGQCTLTGRSRWLRCVRSGSGPFACWGCVFESRRPHECLSVVNVAKCEAQFSARSPTLSFVCLWSWSLENEEVRPTRGLRAMNMYTLISSVPKLRPGQPVFVSRQRQWLFPPSECRPVSYPLYSKDRHDRHEATAQNTLEFRPPPPFGRPW
jgi:hypothetical protein